MNDEGGRMKDEGRTKEAGLLHRSSFIPPASSFILRRSSFIVHPLRLRPLPDRLRHAVVTRLAERHRHRQREIATERVTVPISVEAEDVRPVQLLDLAAYRHPIQLDGAI